jgi:hypothetical protein
VILLVNVESALLISEKLHDVVVSSDLLYIVLAKTPKNFDASSLVMVLSGRKSATLDLEVSPEPYIQATAVSNSSLDAQFMSEVSDEGLTG